MRLEITAVGQQTVEHELLRLAARAADVRPALELAADALEEIERAQFDTRGASGGTPWDPLSEATLKHKTGPGILEETGGLRASLTDKGAPDHLRIVGYDTLIFGSTNREAAWHQHGHSAGRGGAGRGYPALPQRKVLTLTFKDEAVLVKVFQRFIIQGR